MIYMLMKKKYKFNILLVFVLFFMQIQNIYCVDYVEDLTKAQNYYDNKEYLQAAFILEKALDSFPEYKAANILYIKTLYKLDMKKEYNLKLQNIFSYEDKYKLDILDFLINNNELEKTEHMYDSLENNEIIKDRFMEFLYKNGKKRKIIEKYNYYKMVDKIEKDKKQAEDKYFKAIQALKSGERMKAVAHLNDTIKLFPENYIYYLKLGQIYADEKNFFLAEKNFIEALKLQEKKEIYMNLFKLYIDTENEQKMYETAKYILGETEVKRVLKEFYYRQQKERKSVRIIREYENKIYLDKRLFKNSMIGDTFYLQQDKDVLYDMVTGENLGNITENIAKIRVYKVLDKMIIFQVLDKYKEFDLKSDYILKKERAYKY